MMGHPLLSYGVFSLFLYFAMANDVQSEINMAIVLTKTTAHQTSLSKLPNYTIRYIRDTMESNNITIIPEEYILLMQRNCEDVFNTTKNYTEVARIVFSSWDKNGDNVIRLEEEFTYEDSHHMKMDYEIAKARFSQYDVNGDGDVTREEQIFNVVSSDVNKDGEVTVEECFQYEIKKLRAVYATLKNNN